HDNTFAWNTVPDAGLLIIDMDSVNASSPRYKNWNAIIPLAGGGQDTLRTAHNLWIDENGWCYVFGANVANGGALIFDLSLDPWNPIYLGMYNDYYLHDGMARGDTLWGSAVYAGRFVVVDVSLPDSTVSLGSKGTPGSVTHNTWVSDNNQVLFATDEIGAAYLTAYDVSDMANITELDRLQTSLGTGVIPHNAHVYGQYVVTSYYTAGVQIVDAKYPELLVEVGYYDTSPYANGGFYGNWGAYPYFENGLLVCSDIEEGLFVLDPNYVEASRVHVVVYDSLTKAPLGNTNLSFTTSAIQGLTDIDGLANLGTHLGGVDTLTVTKSGYAPMTVSYSWLNGEFDTLKVAMIDTTVFAVDEKQMLRNWVVYPNPIGLDVYIQEMHQGTFVLYDMHGRKIEQGDVVEGHIRLRKQYVDGQYLLYLKSELGVHTEPVIIAAP
ncbi:MAG: hypothetical protein RL754_1165, partial [Bacteroidota bacterium]